MNWKKCFLLLNIIIFFSCCNQSNLSNNFEKRLALFSRNRIQNYYDITDFIKNFCGGISKLKARMKNGLLYLRYQRRPITIKSKKLPGVDYIIYDYKNRNIENRYRVFDKTLLAQEAYTDLDLPAGYTASIEKYISVNLPLIDFFIINRQCFLEIYRNRDRDKGLFLILCHDFKHNRSTPYWLKGPKNYKEFEIIELQKQGFLLCINSYEKKGRYRDKLYSEGFLSPAIDLYSKEKVYYHFFWNKSDERYGLKKIINWENSGIQLLEQKTTIMVMDIVSRSHRNRPSRRYLWRWPFPSAYYFSLPYWSESLQGNLRELSFYYSEVLQKVFLPRIAKNIKIEEEYQTIYKSRYHFSMLSRVVKADTGKHWQIMENGRYKKWTIQEKIYNYIASVFPRETFRKSNPFIIIFLFFFEPEHFTTLRRKMTQSSGWDTFDEHKQAVKNEYYLVEFQPVKSKTRKEYFYEY